MNSVPGSSSGFHDSRLLTNLAIRMVTVFVFILFGFGLRFMIERFSPGSSAPYVPLVLGITSIIAIYSHSRRKLLEGSEKTLFWVSELITLAVLLKVFFLLRGGAGYLQAEVGAWQKQFLEAFFNTTYIFMLVSVLITWILTNYLAGLNDQMHERELDIVWDDLGKVQNSLKQIRGHLIAVFVALLIFFVLITAMASVPIVLPGVITVPAAPSAPIWMAMIFGILILIILSLTQFTLLRSRWEIDRAKVSSGVPRQWLISGLILLAMIGVLAAILPTGYSMSLFDVLIWLSNFILQIASLFLYLLLLPITLISRLFAGKPVDSPQLPPIQMPSITPTPNPPAGFPPILALIRDILLWGIGFAIVSFAFYQFFTSNSILLTRLRSFGVVKWLLTVFKQILALFRGAGLLVQEQIARIQKYGLKLPGLHFSPGNRPSAPQDPRGQIIYLYKELVFYAGKHGIRRQEHETPYQYKTTFEGKVPLVETDIADITDVFVESRYSQHPVNEEAVNHFSEEAGKIKRTLDSLAEQKTGGETPPV